MQGWALPQSCAAVVGALPHTSALWCRELAQTCRVGPQLVQVWLLTSKEGFICLKAAVIFSFPCKSSSAFSERLFLLSTYPTPRCFKGIAEPLKVL